MRHLWIWLIFIITTAFCQDCREYKVSWCRFPKLMFYCSLYRNGTVGEDINCCKLIQSQLFLSIFHRFIFHNHCVFLFYIFFTVACLLGPPEERNCENETNGQSVCSSNSDCQDNVEICCVDPCITPFGYKLCKPING